MHVVRSDGSEPPPNTSAAVRGAVGLRRLVGASETSELEAFLVRFEAGAANLRHSHSFDQLLFITDGAGIVATDNAQHDVTAGDTVIIPAGEQHWHGATPDSSMTHLAVGLPGATEVGGEAYRPPD